MVEGKEVADSAMAELGVVVAEVVDPRNQAGAEVAKDKARATKVGMTAAAAAAAKVKVGGMAARDLVVAEVEVGWVAAVVMGLEMTAGAMVASWDVG